MIEQEPLEDAIAGIVADMRSSFDKAKVYFGFEVATGEDTGPCNVQEGLTAMLHFRTSYEKALAAQALIKNCFAEETKYKDVLKEMGNIISLYRDSEEIIIKSDLRYNE
jgi:hypothetical protein